MPTDESNSVSAAPDDGASDGSLDDRALLLRILVELRQLNDCISEGAAFQKPILTMDEASQLLGVSVKRLQNIIYIEKARLGRMPDFVCDASGTIRQHILRDELIAWVKARRTRRGRPPKTIWSPPA